MIWLQNLPLASEGFPGNQICPISTCAACLAPLAVGSSCWMGKDTARFCSFQDLRSPASFYLSLMPLGLSLLRKTVFDSHRWCRWVSEIWDLGSKWHLSLDPSISSSVCVLLFHRPFKIIQIKDFPPTFFFNLIGSPLHARNLHFLLGSLWLRPLQYTTPDGQTTFHNQQRHHCSNSKFYI